MKSTLVWLRQDLRLEDNPALAEAAMRGEVIPIFIWAPEEEGEWEPGYKSRVWLRRSLQSIDQSLRSKKSKLILRAGSSLNELLKLVKETQADALFWNRRYEPASIERDLHVQAALEKVCEVKTFNASLLVEPWEVLTRQGKPFQVFTAFWKTALKSAPFAAVAKEPSLRPPKQLPPSLSLDQLSLPEDQLEGWEIGEAAAQRQLSHFVKERLSDYDAKRDYPELEGVSNLSPYLHFGEISPRQIWEAVSSMKGDETFLRQLFWREFAYYLLVHFPATPGHALRPAFNHFPWINSSKALNAWKAGLTGYPFVDAGMRQLLKTGSMHNRVRMVVASFLTKDLLIPWQEGAKWFWETLVDADLANNTLGWQWTAGCGADAAPFFRIFNPVLQGEKFDPEGDYIKRYVPELSKLSSKWIQKPWEAPDLVLKEAGIELGKTYPKPLIDHAFARERALQAYENIKKRSKKSRKNS